MCSGYITRHRCCGHEVYFYYYKCPDGINTHYLKILRHRLLGRRFLTNRLCRNCLDIQQQERIDIGENHEQAKCLLEYYRGVRRWPRTDSEVRAVLEYVYESGGRLHPFLDNGSDTALDRHRELVRELFSTGLEPDPGARLSLVFQEMLDRQADIDRTSRPMTAEDRLYRLSLVVEGARFFRAEFRRYMEEMFQDGRFVHQDETLPSHYLARLNQGDRLTYEGEAERFLDELGQSVGLYE